MLPLVAAGVLLAPAGGPRVALAHEAYVVRSWTPNEGLPTSTVYDIVQTADGYLWVATTGGLARFDGVRFEVFGIRDGLPSNRFCGLLAARDGTLYALNEAGHLCHWDGTRFSTIDLHRPLGLSDVLEARDGSIVGSGDGYMWRVRRGRVTIYPDSAQLYQKFVEDQNGTIWFTGAKQYDPPVSYPARLDGDRITPAGPAEPGFGFWLRDGRTHRPVYVGGRGANVLDSQMRNAVTGIASGDLPQAIDPKGRLWSTAGPDVVVRDLRDGKELDRYRLGLSQRAPRLFFDRDGNVWVCSLMQGLIRLAPGPLQLLRPANTTKPIEVLWAREQTDGRVVATDYNWNTWLAGAEDLVPLRDGADTWEGAGTTQIRIAKDDLEIRVTGDRKGRADASLLVARAAVIDPAQPGVVIATYAGDLWRYRLEGTRVTMTDVLHPPGEIRDLCFDSHHRLWVATAAGLWRLAPNDTVCFTRQRGLPADHVRQIHEDRDGVMWFGTYGGGLVRWRDGTFATLDRRHGLIEDVVSVVLEDDHDEFWLAGNAGLQHFPRRQANEVLAGKRARVDAIALARESGLRNPEGSGMPGLRTRDGRLWFPTFDGLAVVDPRRARALSGRPPLPHIEGVTANDHALARAPRGYRVPAGSGRVVVTYTGFDLRAAEQLRFAYRLEGVDADWVEAGTGRTASYTNLPPGLHRFRLAAFNAMGQASTKEDVVTLDVQPHFWQTAWFLILTILAGTVAIVAAVRFRDRRLRERAAELQDAVDVRTAELAEEKRRTDDALVTVEAQANRLEALDRARSRFFASISHEFRTPLTLIHGPLSDVREGLHGELPDGAGRQVEVALDSAERLTRLVDQLLDAARAEAGELRIERKPGDLVRFLERLCLSFVPLAERKGIAFHRELPSVPQIASFDRDALEKVFANLLGNAFKFTPSGGHVTLRAVRLPHGDAPAIDIAVIDDGPGIAAEDLAHVFKRFYRAERSITRMQPGTGLGLALAADMVEQHGGSITVESVESRGSTFTVRLALLPAEAVAALEAPGEPALDASSVASISDEIRVTAESAPIPGDVARVAPGSEGGPLVLVVDDHPDVRAYIASHLRRRYRVAEAGDGVQALASMRVELPDLVVSDVGMPEMDGFQLVSEVRRDPELDFVPVILLTAAASTDSRILGLEGGADDYLTKPFEVRELLARVAQALQSRRRLRDRIARAAAAASVYGAPPPDGGAAPATATAPHASIGPSRTAIVDNAFIRRVREVIEARMGDEDFDVDRLAEAMGVGRTLFYDKVGELFEQTPMALVMNHRLERAGQMLRAGEGNVGEVAYAVGFRSLAHFSRRFREHHGVTPSAYRHGAA